MRKPIFEPTNEPEGHRIKLGAIHRARTVLKDGTAGFGAERCACAACPGRCPRGQFGEVLRRRSSSALTPKADFRLELALTVGSFCGKFGTVSRPIQKSKQHHRLAWRSQGDSNPCFRRERATSWAARRWERCCCGVETGLYIGEAHEASAAGHTTFQRRRLGVHVALSLWRGTCVSYGRDSERAANGPRDGI